MRIHGSQRHKLQFFECAAVVWSHLLLHTFTFLSEYPLQGEKRKSTKVCIISVFVGNMLHKVLVRVHSECSVKEQCEWMGFLP